MIEYFGICLSQIITVIMDHDVRDRVHCTRAQVKHKRNAFIRQNGPLETKLAYGVWIKDTRYSGLVLHICKWSKLKQQGL